MRLRIKWLTLRVSRRRQRAEQQIGMVEALRDLGRRMGDTGLQRDGWSLIDRGAQTLNEIETGVPAEPRRVGGR